ncbi:MAG: TIGR04190 family B12-binding domain/radical SAM domain protein, partial [bacterium]
RKRNIMFGPISDVVPSTPIFEMYPLGFMTIVSYLKKYNLEVRIINLALKMLLQSNLNVEKLIKSLNPLSFGLSLHWLPHVHGCLNIAQLIKKYHPQTPIIVGGISASYYHQELISLPYIDFVIKGDSAEKPLKELILAIKEKKEFNSIPNLTWKNKNEIKVNKFSCVPTKLNIQFDYLEMIKGVIKYKDPYGYFPFKDWFKYPITAILPFKGCLHNCAFCGGGEKAFQKINNRKHLACRPVELLVKDIYKSSNLFNAPIIILGDLHQAGKSYIQDFFNLIAKKKITNHIIFELFAPTSSDYFKLLSNAIPNYSLQISPETHDEEIRQILGKPYSNTSLEKTISSALKFNCSRIDIFFIIGLPKQDKNSVLETLNYCEELIKKFPDKKVHPYIAPLAPFLDPGSILFENPEKYGYKLFAHSLNDHYQLLEKSSWKDMLNYETKWLNRNDLVEITYKASFELNEIKKKYGLINEKEYLNLKKQINLSLLLIEKFDKIKEQKNENKNFFKKNLISNNICVKKRLEWSKGIIQFNWYQIFKSIILGDKNGNNRRI